MYKLLIIALLIPQMCLAQCQAVILFTEKETENIHDVYQFTFLHKTPVNKLDSLILQIMHPAIVIDSNYYDWNSNAPRIKHTVDRIKMNKIIDEIGAMRTKEAFVILSLPYLFSLSMQDDLSPFHTLCSNIESYGGAYTINKYFLENAVSEKLAFPGYQKMVVLESIPLRKKYFSGIKYCKHLQGEERALYEMKQVNPAHYDSIVENIMDRYLSRFPKFKSRYSRDSILMEIMQLPVTADAIWDDCLPLEDDGSGVTKNRLGVLFKVGKDIDNQQVYILRVYTVRNSNSLGQKIIAKQYSVDFLSRVRKQCEEHEK